MTRQASITQESWNRMVRRGVAGYVFGAGFRAIIRGEVVEPVIVHGGRQARTDESRCQHINRAKDLRCGLEVEGEGPFCTFHQQEMDGEE